MSDELVLYTNPMSRGRIARWMLEEIGRPYRAEILDYGTTMKAPSYRLINPMGKVPALKHGETVVTECAAICAYLADVFPDAGLAPPPASRERGPYYRWLFFGAGPIEQATTTAAMGFIVPDDKRAMVGFGTLAEVALALDQALSTRDHIAGDRFSAADVYVGSQVVWGMQFGTIEKRPALERYRDRIMARPAAVRARDIDDRLAAARGARS